MDEMRALTLLKFGTMLNTGERLTRMTLRPISTILK
jgi:hypothetical protein